MLQHNFTKAETLRYLENKGGNSPIIKKLIELLTEQEEASLHDKVLCPCCEAPLKVTVTDTNDAYELVEDTA